MEAITGYPLDMAWTPNVASHRSPFYTKACNTLLQLDSLKMVDVLLIVKPNRFNFLNLSAVASLVRTLAFAICFLHSYANPDHEKTVANIVMSHYPNASVSISSEVASEVREFERASTTVANAYLQPLVEGYLDNLEKSLQQIGYRGRLFIMMSNGGISTSDTAKKFPVRMIESGPAAGALAATFYGNRIDEKDILSSEKLGSALDF